MSNRLRIGLAIWFVVCAIVEMRTMAFLFERGLHGQLLAVVLLIHAVGLLVFFPATRSQRYFRPYGWSMLIVALCFTGFIAYRAIDGTSRIFDTGFGVVTAFCMLCLWPPVWFSRRRL